jgi:hypothetical protein
MELGFNTFYTYRDGETAWVYAQALRFLRQMVGATCFSIDPYQIGFNNDEALESGAFWFYRKLGFRPTESGLAKLALAEEKKIAANREYRTPLRILKTLSKGHVIYELPGASAGDWDRFRIRNLGLAVGRRAASEFNGNLEAMRASSIKEVARALAVQLESLDEPTRRAFDNLAPVLALIPDLARWTDEEKRSLQEIIRAKMSRNETRYARLLQRHKHLRDAIIRLS